jgi:hypothetical protein
MRARSLDVTTLEDSALVSASDEDLLRYAADNGLTILTHNRRDLERLHRRWLETGETHAGILIVPATSPLLQLDVRVAMLVDWASTLAAEANRLVSWGRLQNELPQGLRIPNFDDAEHQLALGR